MNAYINLQNKTYSNHNNILLEIINDLKQISSDINNDLVIQRIGEIIIKMNKMINDNNKNFEILRVEIQNINNNINNQFKQLENKTNQIQEINYKNGRRYVGQTLNGQPEGRGTWYVNNGDRYEGEFKQGMYNGK